MTVTRAGVVLALVALLVPAGLSAQRIPLPGIGRRGPARPAPLPPEIEPVARNLAYKRMRLSVESYPMVSHVRAPAFTNEGPISGWTSFGNGTRADYRLNRHASVTLDLTSSFAGGPADVHTAELGTRLGRERSERTLYSFVDLRVGYIVAQNSYFDAIRGEPGSPTTSEDAFRYSSGFGGLAGVGMEYALTRRFSLTAAGAVMQNRMTTTTLVGPDAGERRYDMTLYRVTLGIRYNPVRVFRTPAAGTY